MKQHNRTIVFLLLMPLFFSGEAWANPKIEKSEKLPKAVEYDGEAKIIYRVNDKEGEHFLFVTQNKKGNFGEADFMMDIRAYKFSRAQKGFTKKWEIKDFSPNGLTTIEWEEPGFVVGDWDGDGIVESALVYKLSPDGLDDEQIKLIAYYKNKKYAIRGLMPRQEGKNWSKKPDKSISKLPKKVQKEINSIWGRLVGIE